jgi:hypothetical protein
VTADFGLVPILREGTTVCRYCRFPPNECICNGATAGNLLLECVMKTSAGDGVALASAAHPQLSEDSLETMTITVPSFMSGEREIEATNNGAPIDLTEMSLRMVAERLGPAFVYELSVHPKNLIWARSLLRQLFCDVADNPLAPYVNLVSDPQMPSNYGWYLRTGDGSRYIGSLAY